MKNERLYCRLLEVVLGSGLDDGTIVSTLLVLAKSIEVKEEKVEPPRCKECKCCMLEKTA